MTTGQQSLAKAVCAEPGFHGPANILGFSAALLKVGIHLGAVPQVVGYHRIDIGQVK